MVLTLLAAGAVAAGLVGIAAGGLGVAAAQQNRYSIRYDCGTNV